MLQGALLAGTCLEYFELFSMIIWTELVSRSTSERGVKISWVARLSSRSAARQRDGCRRGRGVGTRPTRLAFAAVASSRLRFDSHGPRTKAWSMLYPACPRSRPHLQLYRRGRVYRSAICRALRYHVHHAMRSFTSFVSSRFRYPKAWAILPSHLNSCMRSRMDLSLRVHAFSSVQDGR